MSTRHFGIPLDARAAALALLLWVVAPAHVDAGPWQAVPGTGCDVRTVFCHPTNPDTGYAGTRLCGSGLEGVLRSADRGVTWAAIGVPVGVLSLAVSPVNTQRMYRTEENGLYRTGDGGDTWRRRMEGIQFTGGDDYMTFVVVNHAYAETLYTGVASMFGGLAAVYRSVDHAQNWVEMYIPSHLNSFAPMTFAVHPKDPSVLYVAFDGELLRSDNHGELGSWATLLGDFEYARFNDIAIDPVNPNRMYVASEGPDEGGVWRTTDAGETWTLLGEVEGLTSMEVRSVAVDPVHPSTLYAGTHGGETAVFISADGGNTWDPFDDGFPEGVDVNDLAVDPATGDVVLAAASDGLYRYDHTTDAAEERRPVSGFGLEQNRPNPFQPETTIRFHVGRRAHVRVTIYDVRGRRIRTLLDEILPAGEGRVSWDGRDRAGGDVPSGVYFCRLEADGFQATRKIVRLE